VLGESADGNRLRRERRPQQRSKRLWHRIGGALEWRINLEDAAAQFAGMMRR
jgi:hypothetical protein